MFFKDEIDENAKGINIDALKKSRVIREDFLKEFGEIPQSILINDRIETKKRIDIITDEMGGGAAGYQKKKAEKIRKIDISLTKSAMVAQGRTKYDVLSAFPQNVGKMIIKVYCPEKGIIYDPFAGHNSRMQISVECGMDYIGVDVSKRFMKANFKIRDILIKRMKQGFFSRKDIVDIQLLNKSSHDVNEIDDCTANFTITSPPYYNIEYYGDEPEQLGNAKTYDKFLDLLFLHVKENYRILKDNTFCCWFINDFRRDKKFYPYHIDMYDLLCDAGFIPFNIYIVDLGWPINAAFVNDIIKHKLLPKRHEYCLVFKKESV